MITGSQGVDSDGSGDNEDEEEEEEESGILTLPSGEWWTPTRIRVTQPGMCAPLALAASSLVGAPQSSSRSAPGGSCFSSLHKGAHAAPCAMLRVGTGPWS